MLNKKQETSPVVLQYLTDETLLDVIDKGLSALGESPKRAIWDFLEKDFKLARHEVPRNIAVFEEALQKLFGVGYNFLRSLMLKELGQIVGENLSCSHTFSDSVCMLLKKAENEQRRR